MKFALRGFLAGALAILGVVLIVRVAMAAHGAWFDAIPGFVLGAALIALGVYRLAQLSHLRSTS